MPKLKVVKQHGTTVEDAAVKTREVLEEFKQKNAAVISEITWNAAGNEAIAKGAMFKGTFRVDASSVTCDINLSLAAVMFKGKVEDGLRRKLDKAFS
jgi:hypothetical protein